jgi:hypothetical protein
MTDTFVNLWPASRIDELMSWAYAGATPDNLSRWDGLPAYPEGAIA